MNLFKRTAQKPVEDTRSHLINDITTRLDPWICEDEQGHIRTGLKPIPTKNLTKMDQFLRQEETSCQQKALVKKTILSEGYLRFSKKELRKAYISLSPVMLLGIIGTLGIFYGAIKKDVKTVAAATATNVATYYLADAAKEKFVTRTKEARRFWDNLLSDQEERNRVHTEYRKWYSLNR